MPANAPGDFRIRVGSYRYSPFWVGFVAVAAVVNAACSFVDAVRAGGSR